MKRLIYAAALAALTATAGATTSQVWVQSGDTVMIGDLEYVVLSKSDFERLRVGMADISAKVERLYALNSNETGRVALHGRQTHTDITNGLITVTYADGYKVTQTVAQNAVKRTAKATIASERKRRAATTTATETTDPFILARRKVAERRKAAQATTNEVTVTHTAGGAR